MSTVFQLIAAQVRTAEISERRDFIEAIVKEYMPSGSGFDNGTTIDLDASREDRLVFNTAFHHMNEGGFYDGWTEHTVTVKPSFWGTSIKVGGRDRNLIKDYIGDTFHHAGYRLVPTLPYLQEQRRLELAAGNTKAAAGFAAQILRLYPHTVKEQTA